MQNGREAETETKNPLLELNPDPENHPWSDSGRGRRRGLKNRLLRSPFAIHFRSELPSTWGRWSEDETRFYAAEVVNALEYIHSLGLIHHDIKPENLLLTAEGHVKIADFGSLKPMQESRITVPPNAASDDKACTFVGTATYVPLEVLNSSPATFGFLSCFLK